MYVTCDGSSNPGKDPWRPSRPTRGAENVVPGKADLSRDESEETTFSLEMRQHTRSTNSIDKHIAPLKYPYVCFEESWLQGRLSCRFFAVEYLPPKYIRNTLVRVPSHAALLNPERLTAPN